MLGLRNLRTNFGMIYSDASKLSQVFRDNFGYELAFYDKYWLDLKSSVCEGQGWAWGELARKVAVGQQLGWKLRLIVHGVCVLSVSGPSKLNIALSRGLTQEI